MTEDASIVLETRDIKKEYRRGADVVMALRGVSLRIARGQLVAIVGSSGSGKSTFLHLVGGFERPTSGSVLLGGTPITAYGDAELSALRRRQLGFIFQFFNLLPTLTAEENVALAPLLDGQSHKQTLAKARALLAAVGLESRRKHKPPQLSGGEMQRVAIARALVSEPRLVLADEPTGNLDSKTGASILELLRKIVAERGQSLVMVTHDRGAARVADRVIVLRDGLVDADGSPADVLA